MTPPTPLPPSSVATAPSAFPTTILGRVWPHRWLLLIALLAVLASGGWLGARAWHRSSIESARLACRTASGRQNWPALTAAADEWLQLDRQSSDAWLFRAQAAEGVEDWAELARCLGQVSQSDRRLLPSLLKKMQVESERLHRPFDSLRTADEILALDERVLLAHKQGVFVCAMTMQRQELVRRVRRAISLRRESPESYVFLASASWLVSSTAYKYATTWLEADPANEALTVAQALPVYTSEAKTDLEFAATFEHIPPPEALLQKYPTNPELIAYFLEPAINNGDLDRVRTLLDAIPPERQAGDARFLRAQAWLQDVSGELEQAEQTLKRALAVDCYWWQLHHHRHDLLRRLNRPTEASEALERYKLAVDLAVAIRGLKRYEQSFEDSRFTQLLLKLAELCHDHELVNALQLRLGSATATGARSALSRRSTQLAFVP